jgi:hypothetical protein
MGSLVPKETHVTQTFSITRQPRLGNRRLNNSHTRSVMTRDRLQMLVDDGFGYGRDEGYMPWIRITKGLSSKVSNLVVACTPVHRRSLHLLSILEKTAAHAVAWLGATEIREQFPLFPWAAEHPMSGLDALRDIRGDAAPALQDIADDAGIPIGYYFGGTIPYVATTDLVVRVGDFPNDRLVFISCKPLAKMTDPKAAPRVLERLELERRYAAAVGARHVIFTGDEVCSRLKANLDWLMPYHSHMQDASLTQRRGKFVAAFATTCEFQSIHERVQAGAHLCGTALDLAQEDFRAAAWLGQIDIDLTQPVLMSRPVVRDVKQRKAALRNQLLGGLQ